MDIKLEKQPQSKKAWTKPHLIIHGTVEKITAQDKDTGGDDGFYLLSVGPIDWAS